MRRVLQTLLASWLVASWLDPSALAGQDVVLRGEAHGQPVPEAYYELIEKKPDLFSFPGVPWGNAQMALEHTVEGTLPVLVVPALFSDSPEPHVSRTSLQRILFDGPAEFGTLTDFYRELSGGRLELSGQVTPWVRTSLTVAQVTAGEAGLGENSRVVEYIWEALQEADAHVDFGQFDNDGPDGQPNSGDDDGVVDVVAFEFLEVSGSCGGPGIWPHRSSISGWTGGDPPGFTSSDVGPRGPVVVDSYIIQSVADCDGRGVQTANVIGHEMGHVLGLPDLYHPIDGRLPTQRRWVIGCWGLMAAGSWGCGDPSLRVEGFGPTRMSPWSLSRLGWVRFEDVPPDVRYQEYRLDATIDGGKPLRIQMGESGRESLVLEYRTREGFDAQLPGQGVLAYLWNLDGVRRPPRELETPYAFRLLEGDGAQDLIRTHDNGGNRGEAKDLLGFPGNAPVLSAVTNPSTRMHDGTPSSVTIHRMEGAADAVRVWISTAAEPGIVAGSPVTPSVFSPYIQFHHVGGGVQPYEVTETAGPPWFAAQVVNDRLDLTGVPDAEGATDVSVTVMDALGGTTVWTATLDVGAFAVSPQRLAGSLLGGGAPGATILESQILDQQGNANGRLDIGDARAHLAGR